MIVMDAGACALGCTMSWAPPAGWARCGCDEQGARLGRAGSVQGTDGTPSLVHMHPCQVVRHAQ